MNDRFKFRAWYDGRYIYKDLCDSNYYTKDGKCIGLANTLPNDLPWEQCTGLKDKNGKLIYDGDIIYPCYEIKWSASGYVLPNGNNLSLYNGSCEVIGNIYEKESK